MLLQTSTYASDKGNDLCYYVDIKVLYFSVGAQDRSKDLEAYEKASRKRKLNATDELPPLKRQKISTSLDGVPTTIHSDDPSQAVAHDSSVFQEHLKKSGYKHLYRHSTQLNAVQNFLTDLEHCLFTFTDLDVLDEDNKFICKSCTERKHRKISVTSFIKA